VIPTKICGITNLDDAQAVVSRGASAIGLIFYEKSPRAISIDQAKSISDQLSDSVSRVGVFVNNSIDFISQAIEAAALNAIQLHGDETPEFCSKFDLHVLKALHIKDQKSLATMSDYNVNGFLFDTFSNNQYGGTGTSFDWSLVKDNQNDTPIILSGGLHPDNILDAIHTVSPSAVDVNSGVESSPGIKDHQKLDQLFKALDKTVFTGFHFG